MSYTSRLNTKWVLEQNGRIIDTAYDFKRAKFLLAYAKKLKDSKLILVKQKPSSREIIYEHG